MKTVRNFGALSHTWDVFPKVHGSVPKRKQNDCKNQRLLVTPNKTMFSKHSKADTHMNSGTVAAHKRPAQVPHRQNPSSEKGSDHKVPPLTKNIPN